MARFHPLDVVDVRRETRDAVVVTLKPRDAGRWRSLTSGKVSI